jgi:hypothetical protein
VRKEDVNTAEVGFNVVPAPVEVADKVAENKKVAEAGAESGEANVEKEKSDYIHQSIQSGKGPTKSSRTNVTLTRIWRPPKKET